MHFFREFMKKDRHGLARKAKITPLVTTGAKGDVNA